MRHLTITFTLALGLITPLVLVATAATQPFDNDPPTASATAAVPAACPSTSTPNAVAVTIANSHIATSAHRLEQGCTTLVVRNASRMRSSLIVARGTTASLGYGPIYSSYVPVERVVRRVDVSTGGRARLTLLLAPGRYLLVASPPQTTVVRSATPFHVH